MSILQQTIEIAVKADTDDAFEETSGIVRTSNNVINMYGDRWAFLRFTPTADLLKGSTISSATLTVYLNNPLYLTMNMTAYGEATDNSATAAATTNNITNRTLTTANVALSGTGGGTGDLVLTGDLSPIIQEVIDRDGWLTGNAISLIMNDPVATVEVFRDHKVNASHAARLTITFIPPISPPKLLDTIPEMSITNPVGGNEVVPVAARMLPNYEREVLAIGGDFEARSTFEVDSEWEALEWLERFLGWHFEERVGDDVLFAGRVHTIQVAMEGETFTRTLDGAFNEVVVVYETSSGAGEATAVASDADAQTKYGKRTLNWSMTTYTQSAGASATADTLLARFKEPQIVTNQAGNTSRRPHVTVIVYGFVRDLEVQYHTDTNTSNEAIDAAIDRAIDSSTTVEVGTIGPNAILVNREATRVTIWSRVREMIEMGDSDGDLWIGGCYGSSRFDTKDADTTTIYYYLEVGADGQLVVMDTSHRVIPPILVKPGLMGWRRDLLPGLSMVSPIKDDIRARFIGGVRYVRGVVMLEVLDGAGEVGFLLALQRAAWVGARDDAIVSEGTPATLGRDGLAGGATPRALGGLV